MGECFLPREEYKHPNFYQKVHLLKSGKAHEAWGLPSLVSRSKAF